MISHLKDLDQPALSTRTATSAAAGRLAPSYTSELLYGVPPVDPLTFIVVPLLLTAVALAACLIPAFHAARIPPVVALRQE
jgi:ABC-type lipoprotein release transport system permease subunit